MYPGSPTSPVPSSMCSPVVAPRCAARGTRRSPRRCAGSARPQARQRRNASRRLARRRSARRSGTRALGACGGARLLGQHRGAHTAQEGVLRPRQGEAALARLCTGRAGRQWQRPAGRPGLCQLGTAACARRQVHEAQGSSTSSTARSGQIYTTVSFCFYSSYTLLSIQCNSNSSSNLFRDRLR
jgi:hypothetical protein